MVLQESPSHTSLPPCIHTTVPIIFLFDTLESIVQSENIIVDIVGSWTVAHKLKELAKMQWISSIDLNGSRNEDDQGIGIGRGLNIHTFDRMLDSSNRAQLGENGLSTLKLIPLKGQHGFFILKNRDKTNRDWEGAEKKKVPQRQQP